MLLKSLIRIVVWSLVVVFALTSSVLAQPPNADTSTISADIVNRQPAGLDATKSSRPSGCVCVDFETLPSGPPEEKSDCEGSN